MKKIGSALFIFLFLFSVFANEGQVTARATVDRNIMRPGDTFTFSISVESEGGLQVENPILPDLTGLEIINRWSGSEVQSTFENGKFTTRRRLNYNYQILASQEGKFNLGSAKVIAGGQEILTKPITIEVSGKAPSQPPQATQEDEEGVPANEDDIFEQLLRDRLDRYMGRDRQGGQRQIPDLDASEAFFIELEVDKKQVYVGEQVTASYYLVTRGQVSDIDTLKYPTLAGFWKEDIELATRLNFKADVINGIQYNRALLASYALFPLKAGRSQVDAYKAKCTIVSFNPFGLPGQKVLTKESPIVDIQVLPLPTENQPASFTGAVGQFEISSNIDKSATKVGEPITLKIRLDGRGNAKLIEMPKTGFPESLEIYSSKSDAKFFKDGRSFKEFEMLLVPRQAGDIVIEPISLDFFDTTKKSYYSLKTNRFNINVLPNSDLQRVEPLAQKNKAQNEPAVATWPHPVLTTEIEGTFWPMWGIYVWAGLYGGTTVGFMIWLITAMGLAKPRASLRRRTHKRLAEIRNKFKKGEFKTVGIDITNLTSQVLGELSDLGGGSLEISAMLKKAPPSFRNKYGDRLKVLMSEFESLAYAPAEHTEKLRETSDINKKISELEKILIEATELEFIDDHKEDT